MSNGSYCVYQCDSITKLILPKTQLRFYLKINADFLYIKIYNNSSFIQIDKNIHVLNIYLSHYKNKYLRMHDTFIIC